MTTDSNTNANTRHPVRSQSSAIIGVAAAALITLASLPVLAACPEAPPGGVAASNAGPVPSRPARTDQVCAAPQDFTLPTPTSTTGTGQSSDQRNILDLATHVHPSSDDSANGDRTYLRYRLATADPAGTDDRSTAAGFLTVDYEYWIGDDRSGTATITRYPPGTPDPQPGTPDASTEHHTYPARRIYPNFPTPFIGDRTVAPPPPGDPEHPTGQGSIRAAVALTTGAPLPCPQRVVILAGLAAAGARYQGTTTDRARRPGIAVTADTDNYRTRDTLTLDPDTGTLLSYELQTMPAPGHAGPPRTELYLLFYANRRTTAPSPPP